MTNYSADDVRDFLVDNQELLNDHLEHYGLPRRSGRYKWGSGKDPYQSLRSSAKAGEKFIKSFSKKSGVEKQNNKRRERTKAVQLDKKKQKKSKYRNEKAYVKTLSDEELKRINTRDQMEATYLKNHPQKQPLPKKLVDKAMKDIVVPAVTEVVKEQGKVYIKAKLNAAQKMINEAVKAETKNRKNKK